MTGTQSWGFGSSIADGLALRPAHEQAAVLAAWGARDEAPAAFARRLFVEGTVERAIRDRSRWQRALNEAVWWPPQGVPADSVTADVSELEHRGLVVRLPSDRLVIPWETVAAAAPYLDERPPLAAARLGSLGHQALTALAGQLDVDVEGLKTRELLAECLSHLLDPDGLAQVLDGLGDGTLTELLAMIDLASRPVDPSLIGAPELLPHLKALAAVGVAYEERGAWFIPVDINETAAVWRVHFLSEQLDHAVATAAQHPGSGRQLTFDEEHPARALRAGALTGIGAGLRPVGAARDHSHSAWLWRQLGAGRPPRDPRDVLARAGLDLARQHISGIDVLDLDDARVATASLRWVAGGNSVLREELEALFGVQPYVRDVMLLRSIRQVTAADAPELGALFRSVLARQLGSDGVRVEELEEATDAIGAIVGQWFVDFLFLVFGRLRALPTRRALPRSSLQTLVWRSAQWVAAQHWRDAANFSQRFSGQPPLATCGALLSTTTRQAAETLAGALLDDVLTPLQLARPVGEDEFALHPLVSEAVELLLDLEPPPPERRFDDAHGAVSVDASTDALVLSWPRQSGSIRALVAAAGSGSADTDADELTFRVAAGAERYAPELWPALTEMPGAEDSDVTAWVARHRPVVTKRAGVTWVQSDDAGALEAWLTETGADVVARPARGAAIITSRREET